ncbi:MAG: FtsL-like putative cell division protein [Bacteroidales bacterium]|jgi:hypothetical protein|nr:FtsL-like putative cell division protein [Bacteroidales bacterium]MDD3273768.1 FtsL-like putative cell division protein [Bacteroidales bacterium]MDD4058149.1 FtsL-like putative cell division protein [Bacteroidales bacterium]
MAKRKWVSEIMGGQILIHSGILQQMGFVLYLFVLVIFYISLNFTIESKLINERHNQRELKNLKADYTGKRARLLYKSKRAEIEKMLIEYGSDLKSPADPPAYIKLD